MARRRRSRFSRAFTMVELLTVVGIIGVLSTIAIPGYSRLKARARRAEFMNELGLWEKTVVGYALQNGHMPAPQGAGFDMFYLDWFPVGEPGPEANVDWNVLYLKQLASGMNAPIDRTRTRWQLYGYEMTGTALIYINAKHDFNGDGVTDTGYVLLWGNDLDHMNRTEWNLESIE